MREKQERHGKELSKDGIPDLHWDPRALYSKSNTEGLLYLETGVWALVILYLLVTGP